MKKFNIKIGDKDFVIKLSFRSLMAYERLSDKSYTQIETTEDALIYLYACIISSNDIELDWDDFLDLIDNTPNALNDFLKEIYNPIEEEDLGN